VAPYSLGYWDFRRACGAYLRLRSMTGVLGNESLRMALITLLEPGRPTLAAALRRLTSWELEALLQNVERHLAGIRRIASGRGNGPPV
jgi:hypothetical protein